MGSYSKVSKSTYVYLGHAWTLSKKRDTQVFMHPAVLYYCNTHCIIIVIYCNIIVIHSELHTGVYAPISNHFISQTESRHTGVEDSGSCRYIQQQNAAYWNLQSVEWKYLIIWFDMGRVHRWFQNRNGGFIPLISDLSVLVSEMDLFFAWPWYHSGIGTTVNSGHCWQGISLLVSLIEAAAIQLSLSASQ